MKKKIGVVALSLVCAGLLGNIYLSQPSYATNASDKVAYTSGLYDDSYGSNLDSDYDDYYSSSLDPETLDAAESIAAGTSAILIVYLVFIFGIAILGLVSMWKLYTKAGREGWKCIIPIYSYWVLCEIAGYPGWYCLLSLLPIANIVVHVMVMHKLAKSFGKDIGFTLGLIFLPYVFIPIIAFSKNISYLNNAPAPTPGLALNNNFAQPTAAPQPMGANPMQPTAATQPGFQAAAPYATAQPQAINTPAQASPILAQSPAPTAPVAPVAAPVQPQAPVVPNPAANTPILQQPAQPSNQPTTPGSNTPIDPWVAGN